MESDLNGISATIVVYNSKSGSVCDNFVRNIDIMPIVNIINLSTGLKIEYNVLEWSN